MANLIDSMLDRQRKERRRDLWVLVMAAVMCAMGFLVGVRLGKYLAEHASEFADPQEETVVPLGDRVERPSGGGFPPDSP
jgi:hypothetical protein